MQMLADSGMFAFLAYTLLLFGAIIWLELSIRRCRREGSGHVLYPIALQTALLGFALDAASLSRVDFDMVYIVLMCVAAWYQMSRTRAAAEAVAAPDAQVPVHSLGQGASGFRPRPSVPSLPGSRSLISRELRG